MSLGGQHDGMGNLYFFHMFIVVGQMHTLFPFLNTKFNSVRLRSSVAFLWCFG